MGVLWVILAFLGRGKGHEREGMRYTVICSVHRCRGVELSSRVYTWISVIRLVYPKSS